MIASSFSFAALSSPRGYSRRYLVARAAAPSVPWRAL